MVESSTTTSHQSLPLPLRFTSPTRLARAGPFVEGKAVWHAKANLDVVDPNVAALGELVEKLAPRLRDRLAKGARASDEDLLLYEAVARYFLFHRHDAEWWALITRGEAGERTTVRVPGFGKFAADVADFLAIPGASFPFETDAAHLFAWAFQVRRAFHHTFRQRSSAARCRRHGCALPSGNRSSRTTGVATGARCTGAWAT